MTYRFATNESTTFGNTASLYWRLYNFIQAASPNGPGWTIAGESDGTSGGMGITGVITSSASFTSTSWFVAQKPGGNTQFLWYRTSDTNACFGRCSTGGLFTSPDTTLPTAADEFVSLSAANGANGVYFNAVADDEDPYSFFWWINNAGATSITCCQAYMGLNTYASYDNDPYVHHYHETLPFTVTFAGGANGASCTAWDPSGQAIGTVAMLGIYNNLSQAWPADPPTDVNGNPILIDSIFSTSLNTPVKFWKGSSQFLRWADGGVSNGTRVLGGKFIKIGNVLVPWDNTPLL